MHPTPPITSPFPSPFLLPSHKSSLFCPKSVHPNLLLQTSSFPAFLTITCCSPSLPTPAHLLFARRSSSLGVLRLWHVLHLRLRSSFSGSLRYLPHQCSLLQLLPVSCCSCCPSPCCPYSCGYQNTQSPLLISAPYLQDLACCR